MATILVTDGAGAIGSRVCAALARAGHVPVSCAGPDAVGALVRHRPDLVVHGAGPVAATPDAGYQAAAAGLALVEALHHHAVGALVYVSSLAVYGPTAGPADEAAEPAPQDPAASSQRIVECIVEDAGAAHGLRALILRPPHVVCAAAGSRSSAIPQAQNPLARMVAALAAGRASLPVAPADAALASPGSGASGSSAAMADYLDADDLAAAVVAAAARLLAGSGGHGGDHSGIRDGVQAFNLAGVGAVALPELARRVGAVGGRRLSLVGTPGLTPEPPWLAAAPGRAEAHLGWRAGCADLDRLIAGLLAAGTGAAARLVSRPSPGRS